MSPAELLSQIQARILDATRVGAYDQVRDLSVLAQRVTVIANDFATTCDEWETFVRNHQQQTNDGTRSAASPDRESGQLRNPHKAPSPSIRPDDFVIELHWPKTAGVSREDITAADTKASRCLVRFMERLYATLGDSGMQLAENVSTSRGPLVSRSPQTSYRNQRSDEIYSNHPIADSGWYVITHSSTAEKIRQLVDLGRALKLPPGALRAQVSTGISTTTGTSETPFPFIDDCDGRI